MQTANTLLRLQSETRTLLGTKLETRSYCVLAKILLTFCPRPENLSETKFNRNGLNELGEEFSR